MRLLIDTDPGVDDGVALTMALRHSGATVEAITVVAGNAGLAHSIRNARLVTEVCRVAVPVYAGAATPLVRPAQHRPAWIHGADGFGDLGVQPRRETADPGFAPDRIAEIVTANPGEITIVTLGPLTNIALALERNPSIARATRALVMMGGAAIAIGNAAPVAEFNLHADPEAARAVVRAGFNITIAPIESSRGAARLTDDDVDAIEAIGSYAGRLVAALLRHSLSTAGRRPRMSGEQGAACPDAVAMAVALDPDVLTVQIDACVDVGISGDLSTGMLMIDRRPALDNPHNARIGRALDAGRFKSMLIDACC